MIRQISVGSLCGELGGMLDKLQYSPDSLRRYNKVFDEFTEYAGEKEYSQQLGAEFLAWKFDQIGDSSPQELIQRMKCITYGLSAPLLSITTSACCSAGMIFMVKSSGRSHSGNARKSFSFQKWSTVSVMDMSGTAGWSSRISFFFWMRPVSIPHSRCTTYMWSSSSIRWLDGRHLRCGTGSARSTATSGFCF